jgi:hypothetical protein
MDLTSGLRIRDLWCLLAPATQHPYFLEVAHSLKKRKNAPFVFNDMHHCVASLIFTNVLLLNNLCNCVAKTPGYGGNALND